VPPQQCNYNCNTCLTITIHKQLNEQVLIVTHNRLNHGEILHTLYINILTEPYIDDKEVGDIKRQYDDFRKQHNIELQFPVKVARTVNKKTNTHKIKIIIDKNKLTNYTLGVISNNKKPNKTNLYNLQLTYTT